MTIATTGDVIRSGTQTAGALITGTPSAAGDLIVATSTTAAEWHVPLVPIIAAAVPTTAPAAGELPIAFDSTAVTGGLYVWNGSAWVKVSVIP